MIESQLLALIPADAEARGIATRISIIEGGSAADAILQAALRLDVDVVAMASHGRSGLGRLALGSTSEEVARRARFTEKDAINKVRPRGGDGRKARLIAPPRAHFPNRRV
jgi:hypothetical protein